MDVAYGGAFKFLKESTVENVHLMRSLREFMDEGADQYEKEHGHGLIVPGEEDAWRCDILDTIAINPGAICLDVASGTGILTRMLAGWVGVDGHVVATDLSEESLVANAESLPPELRRRVSFVSGDAHDGKLLASAAHRSFDYITCRQGVVMFVDPLAVFRHWYEWLKAGGRVVVLDALWTRRSWAGSWEGLIDSLPLSCPQSLATVPYFLSQAGFVVEERRLLRRVNQCLASTQTEEFDCPRYVVVASKPS
jgi:ubiquinone/menaquinone biosynthesis C-methylase UbiE